MMTLKEACKRKTHEVTIEILDSKNGPALIQWHKELKNLPAPLKEELRKEAAYLATEVSNEKNSKKQKMSPLPPEFDYLKQISNLVCTIEDSVRQRFQ